MRYVLVLGSLGLVTLSVWANDPSPASGSRVVFRPVPGAVNLGQTDPDAVKNTLDACLGQRTERLLELLGNPAMIRRDNDGAEVWTWIADQRHYSATIRNGHLAAVEPVLIIRVRVGLRVLVQPEPQPAGSDVPPNK